MFGFFKKASKTAPAWKDLPMEKRLDVTRKIVRAMLGGPRYKIVSGSDQWQRERGMTEQRDEDEILNIYGRGKMLDLARNATRNSSTWNGILKQLELNTIGTVGGKAILDFDDSGRVTEEFAKWARECGFFDSESLNQTLRLLLKTYVLGGDCVLMLDDGLIEDSGRLIIYEPDEIGPTTDAAIKDHFGPSARQSLGRVYNPNGRFVGCVVSRSQRGKDVFDPASCYYLARDPDASLFDDFWIMPRSVFRVAQGRGISQLGPSLASILDLEDLCGFTLASAKKNAQTLAQVIQSSNNSTEDAVAPSAFDAGTDFAGMSDAEIEKIVEEERRGNVQTMTLSKIAAAGCVYEVLPENFRIELLR